MIIPRRDLTLTQVRINILPLCVIFQSVCYELRIVIAYKRTKIHYFAVFKLMNRSEMDRLIGKGLNHFLHGLEHEGIHK